MEVCDCFFKGTNGFLILLWQGIPSSVSLGMVIQRTVSETIFAATHKKYEYNDEDHSAALHRMFDSS